MSAKRILLIVEDNEASRNELCKILYEEYDLYTAKNGIEALNMLKKYKNKISAVLLDILMPVMDGYQFLEAIKNNNELSNIPIIVITKQESEKVEIRSFSLGATDFLTKPYKPSVIKHRLESSIKFCETLSFINNIDKDKLTGLYNEEFFYKKSMDLMLQNPDVKYDIICSDIHRFKLVNDMFGIKIGDNLLIHIANLLSDFVDDCGVCGRLESDTFAMLIPRREIYNDEIFKNLTKQVNDFPIKIGIVLRYGIYEVDDINLSVNVMCDRAKLAIESIKEKYNVYYACYNDSIRQRLIDEQIYTDNIINAIKEKQFHVYLQPKYDLSTNKIVGAEALVRWNHPNKGIMYPDEFIPYLEKNEFITDLDIYVWDTVCYFIRQWLDKGKQVVDISVNISRVDIYNPNLPDILIDIVNKYNILPKYIHLEITETAYTENPTQLVAAVKRLKSFGFSIEMDDFGKGYSSLNMLSELPIDVLKLDTRFIQHKSKNSSSNNILSFVISLAKCLNLLVVAEGVENREQIEMLRNMGCDYVQGYYYAKPMSIYDFEKLINKPQLVDTESKDDMSVSSGKDVIILESSSDKNMLIIVDIPLNRAILEETFRNDYTIIEINNCIDAMSYICDHADSIDVILVDLSIKKADGFNMMSKFKEDNRINHIPVVVVSQSGGDIEEKVLTMGAADFISKPINPIVASLRVQNILS